MNNLRVMLDRTKSQHEVGSKSPFHCYWDKIEKAEKAYAGAERKRAQIVQQFNEQVLPLEQAHCEAHYELIRKLVGFLDAKSLSKTDKLEVMDWASDHVVEVMNSPFRGNLDVETLVQIMYQHGSEFEEKPTEDELAALREDIRDMLRAQDIPIDQVDIDELINASREGSTAFFEAIEKQANDMFERFQSESEESFDFSKSTDEVGEDWPERSLAKLYKRLVQRLHPDRAKDEHDRERRHTLMLELTEAKRNHDVYTLLNFIREHGDKDDAIFSDKQLEHLVERLNTKLLELRAKKRALKTEQSIEALIYSKFHSKTNREMSDKLKGYRQMLEKKIDNLHRLHNSVENVKQLKVQLKSKRGIPRFIQLDLEDFL